MFSIKRNLHLRFLIFMPLAVLLFVGFFNAKMPLKNNVYTYVKFSNSIEELNFGDIEAYLSQIYYDPSEGLMLNESAESALSKAESRLISQQRSSKLDDVEALIRRSFVGERGTLLSQLFSTYVLYRREERKYRLSSESFLSDTSVSAKKNNLDLIDKREALQVKFFGEDIARELYSSQNRLARKIFEF